MTINKIYEITYDTKETIKAACLSSINDWIVLLSSGEVVRYQKGQKTGTLLFSVKSSTGYEDDGFDINAPSTIYTLGPIIVVANDYKRHAFVHYPGKYKALHLWRGKYHSDISHYPIALFKGPLDVPYLIFGADWNHLQIMNLDTRQIITAAKSLIEEGAEERHVAFYEKYEDSNKLPWPSAFDYFFGKLQMSPNNSKFLSAGWAWGSCDAYNIFDVEHFMTNHRIAYKAIDGWEHDNRAVCWIDDDCVAVTYNPRAEGEENTTEETPSEIHFYKVTGEKSEVQRKIPIGNIDITEMTMQFSPQLKVFILFSKTVGTLLLSLNGDVLFRDDKFTPDGYFTEMNLFIKAVNKTVSVYEIEKDG